MGNKDEKNELLFKNYTDEGIDFPFPKIFEEFMKKIDGHTNSEDEVEERNDVWIYKTLRYPPKSTPPTSN